VIRKHPSIEIELVGGLGNQLFGYFAGLYIAQSSKCDVVFDLSSIPYGITQHNSALKSFLLPENLQFKSRKLRKPQRLARRASNFLIRKLPGYQSILLRTRHIYQSKEIGYDGNLSNIPNNTVVRGYFQSWEYFARIENRKNCTLELAVPSEWFKENQKTAQTIRPIMMHVRRGDYNNVAAEFGLLAEGYFLESTKAARERVGDREIWVFSDDVQVAAQIISSCAIHNVKLIQPPVDNDPAESLLLMSEGSANIVSNSTFSWWAATLNQNSSIVLAPAPWYRKIKEPESLIPPTWMRLPAVWTDPQ
jgi:hypothetical protein